MSGFHVELTEAEQRERADAMRSLFMLAHQVGIKCDHCGGVMRGEADIGMVSWMAPFGSRDYQARATCMRCTEALRDDET